MVASGKSLFGTPIPPLVLRHAQDAAWYWQQLEGDRLSPVVDARRAKHYQRMFTCHLAGLRVAGESGWELARKELERWKECPQLFVCWWLVLQDTDPEKTASLWPFMDTVPGAESAATAALLWSTPEHRAPWLRVWLASNVPQAQRMALTALALCKETPDTPLAELAALFEADPLTVAATCRLVGSLRQEAFADHLLHAAQSPYQEVREQAGVALLAVNRPEDAFPILQEAMLHHYQNMESGEGASALQEEHRTQVLACLYGHALAPKNLTALANLPPCLLPCICAHHGHVVCLSLLADLLDTVYAPLALRAICRITGLDAESAGLCLPPVLPDDPAFGDDPPEHFGRHLESGLPSPDVPKIRAWLAEHASTFPANVPLLRGKEASLEVCLAVLETGMQDERLAAAWHTIRQTACPLMDTTAPVALQDEWLQRLRDLKKGDQHP